MSAEKLDIQTLLELSPAPNPKQGRWSGLGVGYGYELGNDFTMADVQATLPLLEHKLLLRSTGKYAEDSGIRPDYVSWLALKGVGLEDARLDQVAASIDASLTESWDTVSPAGSQGRMYSLGNAALKAWELIGASAEKIPTTFIGLDFESLPTIG